MATNDKLKIEQGEEVEEFPREIRRIPEVKPEEEGEVERERERRSARTFIERGEKERGSITFPFTFGEMI